MSMPLSQDIPSDPSYILENKLDFTGDISEAKNRSLPPGILSIELNLTAPHAARDRAAAAADHSTF